MAQLSEEPLGYGDLRIRSDKRHGVCLFWVVPDVCAGFNVPDFYAGFFQQRDAHRARHAGPASSVDPHINGIDTESSSPMPPPPPPPGLTQLLPQDGA